MLQFKTNDHPPHISLPLGSFTYFNKNNILLYLLKKQEMGVSAMNKHVLKVVHPRKREEYYWHPITAGEIMSKHPRHCIARPDVFQYPWIVVRPESLLLPGQVFYLVPYSTLDKLLKAKKQQLQPLPSLPHNPSLRINVDRQNSPTKSLAGVTPKHRRDLHNNEEYYSPGTTEEKDYSTETSYKTEFYKSWNEARKNLNQPVDGHDQSCSVLDSPLDTCSSCFSIMRRVRPQHMTSPEQIELRRPMPKSCLRRIDSERKKMTLYVKFSSPIVVPGSRRGSPNMHQIFSLLHL